MQLRQSPSMVFRLLDPILPAKHQHFLSTLIFYWSDTILCPFVFSLRFCGVHYTEELISYLNKAT